MPIFCSRITAPLLVWILALLLLQGCGSSAEAPVAAPDSGATDTDPRQVEVFFATDRARDDGTTASFGSERGPLAYGVAGIGIPPNHEIGRHETPSVFKFEWSPDERKHISVRDLQPLDRDEFFERLAFAINLSPNRSVMVFVHGYNTDFEEAVRLLAQFATDLKFSGPVLLFSWPSQGGVTAYSVDETNAEWAQPHLGKVLNDLLDLTPARQVYLVAHSMGSRVITRAYNSLAGDRTVYGPNPMREMILVAPDIDADVFRQDIAPRLARNGIHVTLYASSADRALMASKAFHGYARAGDSSDDLVIVPGVETVDARDAQGGLLGHSYFAEDRRIMEDIFGIVQTGQRADNRFGLQAVDVPAGRYWTFRK
jgi:esterase/lipase superfamily enzyme